MVVTKLDAIGIATPHSLLEAFDSRKTSASASDIFASGSFTALPISDFP